MQKGTGGEGYYSDVNHEVLLRGCNAKLTAWMEYWDAELKKGMETLFDQLRFRCHIR